MGVVSLGQLREDGRVVLDGAFELRHMEDRVKAATFRELKLVRDGIDAFDDDVGAKVAERQLVVRSPGNRRLDVQL